MLSATSAPGLLSLLERLPKRLLAEELIATPKDVAEIATERQLRDSVGASWAVVAAGKEVEEGAGNLLPEIGA